MLYLPNIHFIFKSEHLFCSKLSTFVVKESSVIILPVLTFEGFPCGSVVKNPPAMQEMQETVSIPGSGRPPGGGHGNPLQYSCLENPMERGAWRTTVMSMELQSRTQLKWLSMQAFEWTFRILNPPNLTYFQLLVSKYMFLTGLHLTLGCFSQSTHKRLWFVSLFLSSQWDSNWVLNYFCFWNILYSIF